MRVWGKGSTYYWWTGATALEISVEILQKVRNIPTTHLALPHLGFYQGLYIWLKRNLLIHVHWCPAHHSQEGHVELQNLLYVKSLVVHLDNSTLNLGSNLLLAFKIQEPWEIRCILWDLETPWGEGLVWWVGDTFALWFFQFRQNTLGCKIRHKEAERT